MAALETLQTLLTIVTLISVPVGVIYHIMTLRNQKQSRQASLFMQLYDTYRSPEFRKIQMILGRCTWTDFDDCLRKYGPDADIDAWSNLHTVAAYYNGIGVLVKKKMVSVDLVEELLGNVVTRQWWRWGPILVKYREKVAVDQTRKFELWHGFEYLAELMHSRGTYPKEQ
jgi:hypothetical protein